MPTSVRAVKAVSVKPKLVSVADLNTIKFDHTTDSLRKSFGVSKELEKQCQEAVSKAYKASRRTSEMIDHIWNNDHLPLNARIYAIYRVGMADGLEAGMHHAAMCTAELMTMGRSIRKAIKK